MKSFFIAAPFAFLTTAATADYVLSVEETGLRDYYCQVTVSLENTSDAALTEINGHFFSFVGDEQVGRSKGASFLNIAPGASAITIFETPNAPCDDVNRYEFVVGACRISTGFEDKALCAGRITGTGPIAGAVAF